MKEELDLKELLQIVWERKMQIIMIIAIFMVIGIIYSLGFVTPKYQALTTLLLATNSSSDTTASESITTTDITLNSKLVATYSDLVKSKKIIRNVISNLALDPNEEEVIRKNVSVSERTNTEIIEIVVKNTDPVLAAKITNEIAKVFIENVKEYYKIENVHVVDEAEINEEPCNINHTKDVVIFAAIGFVVALMYVFIANLLDTTIKSQEDIEKIVTVLASIPLYDMNEGKGKSKDKRIKGGVR